MKNLIVIDNEVLEVTDVNDNYIEIENGTEYIIFKDQGSAGESARDYWEDMAKNDKSEFVCMVGEETLIDWCLSNLAGPGSTKVSSLEDWLDLWLDIPEEHFASYDGEEIGDIRFNKNLSNELGFDYSNAVIYRVN